MRLRAFVPAVHGFLDTIREGHPTRRCVVSLIVCPIHEDTPGPSEMDAQAWPRAAPLPRRGDPAEVVTGKLTLQIIREELAQIEAARDRGPHLGYLDGPSSTAQRTRPSGLCPTTSTRTRRPSGASVSGSHARLRGRRDLPHSTGLRRQPSSSNGDEFDAPVESALSPSTQRGGWMTSIDDVRDREPRARAREAVRLRQPEALLSREHLDVLRFAAAAADSGSRPCVDRSRLSAWSTGYAEGPGYTVHDIEADVVGDLAWCAFFYHVTGVPPPATRSTCGSGHRWCTAASTGCGRSFIPTSPCCSTRVPGRPSSASLHHAVPDALLSIRSAIVRPAPTVSPWLRQSRPDNSMTPTASTTGESCGRLPSPSSARVTSPRA